MLSANPRLERELRLPIQEKLHTQNGGIPVRLLVSRIPSADALEIGQSAG
jgi:hypothetical protein